MPEGDAPWKVTGDCLFFLKGVAMELLGRYKILNEIGRGGMGVVYRATDSELSRTVAIKTLHLAEYATPQEVLSLRERLLREARAAANLNHPNIVAVYDFGQEGDVAYVVMEFVEGCTLQDLLAESTPPPQTQVLRILSESARALDYAHASGAVHRDVKPANIMVRSDGAVKIADFGIAKLAWTKTTTETGMIMGSPHFMAPEQLRGEKVTARTDQFALAGVAYNLLTGHKPFDADTVATLFHKILHEDPVPAKDLNTALEPGVDRALRKAMAKNPEERYESCAAFVETLGAAWIEKSKPGSEAMRRRWLPVIAAVAAALVLLTVLGTFLYRRHQAGQAENAYWHSIKDGRDATLFEAYLKKYPDGRFTSQARSEIDALARVEAITGSAKTARAQSQPPAVENASKALPGNAPPVGTQPAKGAPAVSPTGDSGEGTVKTNPDDGQPYAWIAPGSFQMGCSAGDEDCDYPERPAHAVTITKGFWMGQTEVTVDAYERFADATGRKISPKPDSPGNHPMVLTSWEDASAYCKWAGGRLPTEAEWEYAARAGTVGQYYSEPDTIAWYDANSGYQTHPVRQKAPNRFKLYDMLGNVWERVSDWFSEDYYAASGALDPPGPSIGQSGVVRGGSYSSRTSVLRASYRGMKRKGPEDIAIDIGFRCVRETIR